MKTQTKKGVTLTKRLNDDLASIYQEIMWLAARPNVTGSRARAWYTHIMANTVRLRVRMFSGKVSKQAIANTSSSLRLEHYNRLQTTLTKLIEHHHISGVRDPKSFIATIRRCERVHIVTLEENYLALRAKGNYESAKIKLVSWSKISKKKRKVIYEKVIAGKVANASKFRV